MKKTPKKVAVLLMTYGSPATLDDIPEYLRNVYGGKEASEETIKEFRRRYGLIGGSPLIKITKEQAAALEKELGPGFRAAAAMRFSHPFIREVVPEISKGASEIVGIIMSPQYSPIIMKGYRAELESAVSELKNKEIKLKIVKDWHTQPFFIQAIAERVEQALARFKKKPMVLFSAHSMPRRVIENEPDYINHLKETAALVAREAGIPGNRWMFCYQSAGHTPEEWLKPDFADIMPILKEQGEKSVLIAPIQFLADHLEILYDIEVGAREQAEEHGLAFARTESLNTSPLFIKALAEIVRGEL